VPEVDEKRLEELVAEAGRVLDEVVGDFDRWLGAASQVNKGFGDFATAADLAIEERVAAALRERTGIDVHGEEHGGPDLRSGAVWVLDPIDGTANYSMRIPLTGILLALIQDGEPVAGLTWLPFLGQRWVGHGDQLWCNGRRQPRLTRTRMADIAVAFGQVRRSRRHERYPTRFRFALLDELSANTLRVRMFGSTAVDLAWVAGGICGGAVIFGDRPWDNAAGVCLVRAAGGVATDLEGRPWRLDSPSVLAAAPGAHEELLAAIRSVGTPDSFTD